MDCPKCGGDGLGEWGGDGLFFGFEDCSECEGTGEVLVPVDKEVNHVREV